MSRPPAPVPPPVPPLVPVAAPAEPPTSTAPAPSLAQVERIAALADPRLRNLQITQCYHELSAALAARTGGGANWCTFATWASKQAGQTIRQEDLARALEQALAGSPLLLQAAEAVARAARAVRVGRTRDEVLRQGWAAVGPAAMLQRAGRAVARGNQKVFAEIGREFARFLALCPPGAQPDAAGLAAFQDALRPGEPPAGQGLLREAFAGYHRVLSEPEPKRRAELLLLANLRVGLHEQTRLQPEIAEAVGAALPDPGPAAERLVRRLLGAEHGWARAW